MSIVRHSVAASIVVVSIFSAHSALASCGASFCTVNTSSGFMNAGLAGSTRLDLRYEFIEQDQPLHGDDRVSVGEISQHHDEVRTVNRNLLLGLEHHFSRDWAVGLTLPLIDRSHTHVHNHHHGGTVEHIKEQWDFQEVGDLRVTARHEIVAHHEQSFGVSFGVKLPTGRTDIKNADGDAAERSLQPGSGTTDLLLGAHWRVELSADSRAFASISADIAGPQHDDFQPGNKYQLDLGWQKSFGDRLSIPIQLNIAVKERDRGDEAEPEDSGNTTIALSPGVNYQLSPNWLMYGYYQHPLYRHGNGVQLTANWSAVVGASFSF
jgi:hypothetical protein